MGIPLYVICCFSFIAFNIFSLPLIFVNLINMYLGVFLLYPVWDSLHFLDLGDYFLSHVREVFDYNLFKYFLSLFLSSLFGTPIMRMLVHLMLSQRSLKLSSCLFFLFSLICSVAVISTILSSSSLIRSSASFMLLLIHSSVFFISVIVFFNSVCLFLISSISLLNISCIFLVCASILFPRSWIIFTVITLNSFSVDCLSPLHLVVLLGFCLTSSSATYFSAVSFCLTFFVCGLRSTACRVIVPLDSGVFPLVAEAV